MEETIKRRLIDSEELTAKLATAHTDYGEVPAIFYQKAPADTDSPENLYPQIIFSADKFSDAVHGVAGLLTVEVISTQYKEPPDEIEKMVRGLLEGVFFKRQDGEIFSLSWQKTDVFTEPASERTPLIVGVETTFEIYEWSSAVTQSPDPIDSINHWAQFFDENLMVIGLTEFENYFIPSREKPAAFFDMQTIRLSEQKSSSIWLEGVINAHVFAPTVKARREWLLALQRGLIAQGRITMDDGSPMHLQRSEINFQATEIQGQLQTTWAYGVIREYPYAHPISERQYSSDEKLRWQNYV